MSNLILGLQVISISLGVLFFLIGTIGIIRFPDTLSRIHALTKADNLGLGFIVFGILPSLPSVSMVVKVLFCWLLILAAAATNSYLVAKRAGGEQ